MSSVITVTRPADKNGFNVRDGTNILPLPLPHMGDVLMVRLSQRTPTADKNGLEADTVTTWNDLTKDEREFLAAWRQADAVRQGVALEILLNSQQHGDNGERGDIISFEDARRRMGNYDS